MVKEVGKSGGMVKPAEYARLRGVSEAAISKAISAGKITLFEGGLIHPDLADAQWYATSRAAKQQVRAGQPGPSEAAAAAAPAAAAGEGAQAARQRMDDDLWRQLKQDEARRAKAEADTAEMKAAQLAGRLIDAPAFLQAVTDASAMLGAAMERVADKLSGRLAAESDPARCHELISQEMNNLRRDTADAIERLVQRVDNLQQGLAPETAA